MIFTEKELKEQRKKTLNECDMLQGNINRMFVTNDVEELNKMYDFAQKRLLSIFLFNVARLKEGQ